MDKLNQQSSSINNQASISNNSNATNTSTQMQDPIRLAAIRAALKSLKTRNEKYLEHFELNKPWRKIYNALLSFNHQQELSQLVELKVCEANGRQKSFFDPFSKTPISVCYNKINLYEIFEKQVLYNLVLHYDNKVKPETNWNLVEPTIKSVVRALHISGICQKDDKQCFEDEVKWRVLDKERFQGLRFNFDQLYRKGLEDYEPISQVMSDTTTL